MEFKEERVAWNKGLTKEDPRVAKYSNKKKGKRCSEITKLKISHANKGKRDRYLCQQCFEKQRKENINAHHIVAFKEILEKNKIDTIEKAVKCNELWDINNGITLCVDCHKEQHTKRDSDNLRFNIASSDTRRTIYANDTLLNGKEVSIIKLNKGKAIGGCMHDKEEYWAIISGCVMVMHGVENIIALPGDAGTFFANKPHAFLASEDSIVMEWGISPEEKKSNKKDEEMLNRIKEFNSLNA